MFSDSNSPFDQALSRPFLDEPTKKKWSVAKLSSWFSRTNDTNEVMPSTKDIPHSDVESIAFTLEDHDGDDDSCDCETVCLLPRKEEDATKGEQKPSQPSSPVKYAFDEADDANRGA